MAGSITFMTVLAAISHAIVAVFSFLLAKHNTKNDKKLQKEKELEQAKQDLSTACDTGSISDLIDATLKIKKVNDK